MIIPKYYKQRKFNTKKYKKVDESWTFLIVVFYSSPEIFIKIEITYLLKNFDFFDFFPIY